LSNFNSGNVKGTIPDVFRYHFVPNDGSVFDQRCNLLRVQDVNRVAGSGDFDFVATGPCGIPAFERMIAAIEKPLATEVEFHTCQYTY